MHVTYDVLFYYCATFGTGGLRWPGVIWALLTSVATLICRRYCPPALYLYIYYLHSLLHCYMHCSILRLSTSHLNKRPPIFDVPGYLIVIRLNDFWYSATSAHVTLRCSPVAWLRAWPLVGPIYVCKGRLFVLHLTHFYLLRYSASMLRPSTS